MRKRVLARQLQEHRDGVRRDLRAFALITVAALVAPAICLLAAWLGSPTVAWTWFFTAELCGASATIVALSLIRRLRAIRRLEGEGL